MGMPVKRLDANLTTGEIARRLKVPVHRVEYHISSRGIEPVGRAGAYRMFSAEQVRGMAAELQAAAAEPVLAAKGAK